MPECRHCGAHNLDKDTRICPDCGQEVEDDEDTRQYALRGGRKLAMLALQRAAYAQAPTSPSTSIIVGSLLVTIIILTLFLALKGVLPPPVPSHLSGPSLTVNTPLLNFGEIEQGKKAVLSVVVKNSGAKSLSWIASTNGVSWLKLETSEGTLQPGNQQAIRVITDTSYLKIENYSTVLSIRSNDDHTQTEVKVRVIPPNSLPQHPTPTPSPTSSLTVSLSSMDASSSNCSLNSDGTYTCTISVGETGQSNLSWSASSSVGGTISPTSGQLSAGQTQQSVTISSLPCQNGNISFNAQGSTGVTVSWSCSSAPPSPTTTPSPSPTPTLSVTPSSLSTSDCSANGDGTYTCTVNVSESAQGDLSWSASSSVGGTISPTSGQLSAGQTQQSVTISSLPCLNGNISFNAQGSTGVTVSWSCSSAPPSPSPSPTPTLSVTPSSLSTSDCSANGDGTYTCTVNVSESAQGDLSWSASSSVGGTISPTSGQLSAGQTQQSVTISSIPCQSGSFTFTGQNSNSMSVTWSCTAVAPVLTITPNNLDASNDCSYTDGSGFSCNAVLSTNSDATSNLNWSVASGGSSATFTPSSGTLSPDQTATVNLLIPDSASLCPFTNSFSITDQNGNSYPISFTCPAPSVSVQPQTMSSSSCTQNRDESWTCLVTISLGQYNFGSLHWTATAGGGNSSGVAFNPSSGDLTSGQSTTVTVTVPAARCPASAVFSFNYNQTSSSVNWSC